MRGNKKLIFAYIKFEMPVDIQVEILSKKIDTKVWGSEEGPNWGLNFGNHQYVDDI